MQLKAGNSILVVGRAAKDVEYKLVGANNIHLAKFSLKVGERSVQGQEKPEAIWCNCVCWHSTAKAARRIHKGDTVFAVGALKESTYTGSDGIERSKTELICEGVFLQQDRWEAPEALPEHPCIPPPIPAMSENGGFTDENDLPF